MAKFDEVESKTRLLLYLWDLNGIEEQVKKGELTKRLVRSGERSATYQGLFEELESKAAIALARQGSSVKVSLTEVGVRMLGEGLQHPEFHFSGNQIGTRVANALLKWIRQQDAIPTDGAVGNGQETAIAPIADYEEFSRVLLALYDKLNREYNLDDLVPIYRLRRELGDRVSRSQFNEWLLEMQANDIFQLKAGEMPDLTPDRREDSLTLPSGGFRYYAKLLNFS